MIAPAFNDRVEKKYQIGIADSGITELWRGMGEILRPYGILPVQEITSVGSVYFDNKDCDFLRFSLLGRLMLFRTRAYELFGQGASPISEYWVEVKTSSGARRIKKRFSLAKSELMQFLSAKELNFSAINPEPLPADLDHSADLYQDAQETLVTMGLAPMLLVTCKRLAFQGAEDRLSIDWDVKYFSATERIFEQPSWKNLPYAPLGKADKIILETKFLGENLEPPWLAELQRHYPIRAREFLKPVEGMGYLFQGPLQHHREANYFLPRINDYMVGSLLG